MDILLRRKVEYDIVRAVDNVDLRVEWGEILGLLGPNGSGKTTFLLLVSTLLWPDGGTVYVNGYDVRTQDYNVRRSLAGSVILRVMSDYWMLTPRQELRMYAGLYGVPRREANAKIEQLLEEMDLLEVAGDEIRKLSSGMRMKLNLVKALLPDNPIILFDEPTVSLDIMSAQRFRDTLKKIAREEGKTIVLSTHNMEEAEYTCDRVAILKEGRLLKVGSPDSLREMLWPESLLEIRALNVSPELVERISHLEGVSGVEATTHRHRRSDDIDTVRFLIHTAEEGIQVHSIVEDIEAQGGKIIEIQHRRATLSEIFTKLTAEVDA